MTPIPGEAPQRLALWSLLFGNFVIGTGVLLPAGLLNVLGAHLLVPPATAGLLLFAGGLVVGVANKRSIAWSIAQVVKVPLEYRHSKKWN